MGIFQVDEDRKHLQDFEDAMFVLGQEFYDEFFAWVVKKKMTEFNSDDFVKWAVRHPKHGAAMRAMKREDWFNDNWKDDVGLIFDDFEDVEYDFQRVVWRVYSR